MSEEKECKDKKGQGELFHGLFPVPGDAAEKTVSPEECSESQFYGETLFGKKLQEGIGV